jgi:hypothetical protein
MKEILCAFNTRVVFAALVGSALVILAFLSIS